MASFWLDINEYFYECTTLPRVLYKCCSNNPKTIRRTVSNVSMSLCTLIVSSNTLYGFTTNVGAKEDEIKPMECIRQSSDWKRVANNNSSVRTRHGTNTKIYLYFIFMYFWPIKIRKICTNFCGCFWSDIAAFIIIIIIKIVTLIIGTKVLLCYYRLRIVFYPLCAVVQFLFLSHNYGFYHFNPLDLWNGISLVCLTLSNTEYVNLILLHKNEWYY